MEKMKVFPWVLNTTVSRNVIHISCLDYVVLKGWQTEILTLKVI
jgi:hypothetical protein